MRLSHLLPALAGAVALTGAANAANLVTNGGFETLSGVLPANGGGFEFGASYNYPNAVPGWSSPATNAFNVLFRAGTAQTIEPDTRFSASETQLLQIDTPIPASPDGGNFMAIDGDTGYNGPLQQVITGLIVGAKYTLQFYWAATQFQDRTGPTTERIETTFGGVTQVTATKSIATHGFDGWTAQTYSFTATAVSDVLSFLSIGTPNGLPPVALIDGVSLTQDVPEPATLALLGVGIAGLGFAARRRRA